MGPPRRPETAHMPSHVTTKGHSSVGQTAVQSVGQTAVQSVGQTALQSVAQTAVQSVGQTAVQSVGQTALQSVAQTSAQSVGQTAVQSVGQTAVQSVGQTAVQSVGQTAVGSVGVLLNKPSALMINPQEKTYQAAGGAVLHLVNGGQVPTAVTRGPGPNTVHFVKGVVPSIIATHISEMRYGAPPQADSVHATFGSTSVEECKNGDSSSVSPYDSSVSSRLRHRRCDDDLDDDDRSLNLHIPEDGCGEIERRTVGAPDMQLFQRFLSDISGTEQHDRPLPKGGWLTSSTPVDERSEEDGDENDDDDSIINVVT